jgi:DNA-binding CsgD family transcriptional regulator
VPVKYDRDTRAKAIWLVREHVGDYPSEHAAITAVPRRLGISAETLRTWSRTSWKAGPSAYGMIVERPDAAEKMCGMPGVPVGGHRGRGRRHRSRVPRSVAGWRDREVVACRGRRTRRNTDRPRWPGVSPAGQAVARLAGAGRSSRQTAAELEAGVKAVEFHLGHIFGEPGIRSRTDLIDRFGTSLPHMAGNLGS